tara:strand:+ start:1151 stop:1378 length:228 start_codon:yes stop_codon:yes gene_type:complete
MRVTFFSRTENRFSFFEFSTAARRKATAIVSHDVAGSKIPCSRALPSNIKLDSRLELKAEPESADIPTTGGAIKP